MQSPEPQPSPDPSASPQALTPQNGEGYQQQRRSSFGFLRRQKSSDMRSPSGRSVSNGKISKKQKVLAQQEQQRQREAAAVPKQPPRLPVQPPLPQINTFGGEDARPDSLAIVSNRAGFSSTEAFRRPSTDKLNMGASTSPKVPIPPIPGSSPGNDVDPYARTESMTHRGRYSYASSAISTINSPRRVRRRKDPTPFK